MMMGKGLQHFIKKALGKARGSKVGLWVRGEAQERFGHVGKLAGSRGGLVIFVGIVSLAILCVGIQNVRLDTTLASLWTPDSGRLLQEMNYVSRVSGLTTDTNEMLIQTPKKDGHQSLLNPKALLEHLQVLQKALSVTIDLYDVTWSLKDLCYSANIPTFDVQFIDQIFEKIFPCVIITPLDCFWEGAKLLGPDFPIQIPAFRGPMKWTNLNPQELLMKARLVGDANVADFPFEILEGFMKRAGIGSGYQEKPCLDPQDPECPITAPNKGSPTPPDVASILAQGCFGFAPRFMSWAPDLIIGGIMHNKSGHVVKAGGLMSTVQLMSSSELYDFYRETWRLHHVEWTEPKAQAVLTTWQTRFALEVSQLTMDEDRSQQFNFYSFTPAGLDSVVESASQFSWSWGIARVTAVMITSSVVGVVFSGGGRDKVPAKVRMGLALGGSIIALLGTAAGSGVSCFLKIPFNVVSVQVLPYLTMAMVSQVFYILLYSLTNCDAKSTLKKHGWSLMLGVVSSAVFIAAGALFPIPAVRSLALQCAIFVTISSFALLVLYPAVCQMVLKRRKVVNNSSTPTEVKMKTMNNIKGPGIPLVSQMDKINSLNAPSSATAGSEMSKEYFMKNNNVTLNNTGSTNNATKINLDKYNDDTAKFVDLEAGNQQDSCETTSCSSKNWVDLYLALLNWRWFTGIVLLMYLSVVIAAGVGISRLRLGLPITDVVPSHSSEWEFLTAQIKLFPVYHMKAVTKANFDYPSKQKLLHKFHETMSGLPWVIRDDNGAVAAMWLSVFRSWLLRLQEVFDDEWKRGLLNKDGWKEGASADGILAWKLAVQTGHVDHPVDVTQLPNSRLVNGDGEINPRAFYVYLTAWAWNDPLAYGSTAANLKPEPRNWVHSPEDKDLKIPKSAPIKYAEITYLLRTSQEGELPEQNQESQILAFVSEIRKICETFEARGLPVFPWGIPFRFYEQYLNLPMNSGIVLGLAAGMTCVILFFSLGFSLRPVAVVVMISLVTMSQIAGTVGWFGVGLNALPVEISLLGVSFIVFISIQIVVAFCCIPGTVLSRYAVSFNLVGPPCVQSLVLITLTALILYSPDFTFIFTHFTLLIAISALFSLVNFLLLLPVLMTIIQPKCWLMGISREDPTLLTPLTPSPVVKRKSSSSSKTAGGGGRSSRSGGGGRSSSRNNNYPPPPYNLRGGSNSKGYSSSSRGGPTSRTPSEHSLSTITEEPTSCATRRSTEVVVQPQVVVETFDRDSSTAANTTKVSAKFKVEVHSSIHSNPHTCVNTSTNMSENSGTSGSTSSSGSFTSSSASSSTSSYHDRISDL